MPRRAPQYRPLEPRPRDLSAAALATGGAMSIPEVAAFLTLHPKTVASMCASGELPSARIGRRRVLYRAAVELWLAQHRAG